LLVELKNSKQPALSVAQQMVSANSRRVI
jgi:hypothetical protein